jgi:DNA polymerase-3 subunit alpha
MASQQFVHLHVHSEYSLLDGLSNVEELVGQAASLGMPALALTDHGVLYGAIDFYQAARYKGIKPIIGVEAYVAPRGMTERSSQDRQYSHLVLLARDYDGYRNLLKLVTRSHLEGYFYRPRIDRELLAEHAKGLIALSACPSGDVARGILQDDLQAARDAAGAYREILGPDSFWLELQAHGLTDPDEAKIARGKIQLSRELGIPLVATNDVHYTHKVGAQTG